MKTQLINTLIAILFSSVIMTAESSEPSITSYGSKSFIVDASIWKSATIDVTITSESGETLYSDRQELNNSIKYNLDNLAEGNYVVTISNEIKTVNNNITINNNGLIIDFQADTVFKPFFTIDETTVDVNYLAKGADTKIYIENNNGKVFESNIEDSLSINKRYDISQLPAGSYNIVVSNKNGTFYRSFKK